jgi:hypothetical protein
MTTTEQTPSALDSYLHYSEPFMPTEADDAELRALVEQAHTEAAALTRDELVGWVKRAEREKKASKETSLSRAQINLAGVLVHLAGEERAAELSTKHMGDERHWHIAMFTDKKGASAYMLALIESIHPTTTEETTMESTTPTPELSIERVPASEVAVGDRVGGTRSDSRKAIAEGHAAQESAERGNDRTPTGTAVVAQITSPNGRVQLRSADGKMIRSCEPATMVWRGRMQTPETPTDTNEETTTVSKPKTTTPAPSTTWEWPTEPTQLLAEYLTERTSADHDAPTRYLPTVTAGVLRVHPSDWVAYLAEKNVEAPKKLALQVLKDAGLKQKVYALPGTDGKSAGFYTGAVPAGVTELPERVVQRGGSNGGATRKPRSPFGKLTDDQRALLVKVLAGHKAKRDETLRDQLLAHLEPAEETTPAPSADETTQDA